MQMGRLRSAHPAGRRPGDAARAGLDEWHLALLPKLHLPLPGARSGLTDGTAWEISQPSELERLQGDTQLRVRLVGETPADIEAAYASLRENCGWTDHA